VGEALPIDQYAIAPDDPVAFGAVPMNGYVATVACAKTSPVTLALISEDVTYLPALKEA
jgi:hypothetical protein